MAQHLVFIHGMWSNAETLRPAIRFFEEKGYSCSAESLPYHESLDNNFPQVKHATLQDYITQQKNCIEELEEEPVLIGHSLGGLLAQILASKTRVKGIILLNSAGPSGLWGITPSAFRSSLFVLKNGPRFWKKPHRPNFHQARYALLNCLPEIEAIEVHNSMLYESGMVFFQTGFWFLDWRLSSYVHTKKISAPMLIVGGNEDRITPPFVQKGIYKKYRKQVDTEIKLYEKHAHWIFQEPGALKILSEIHDWIQHKIK